jgi:chaperonin GroES
MERLQPFHDRVLVVRSAVEETTKGGLFVPKSSQEKPLRGVVLEVGPSVKDVAAGQTVLFGRYSGQVVTVNNEEYMLLRQDELLGLLVTV